MDANLIPIGTRVRVECPDEPWWSPFRALHGKHGVVERVSGNATPAGEQPTRLYYVAFPDQPKVSIIGGRRLVPLSSSSAPVA